MVNAKLRLNIVAEQGISKAVALEIVIYIPAIIWI